jgi:hypothetical protein
VDGHRHWAEDNARPDPRAEHQLRVVYGEDGAGAIEVILRLIRMGNPTGNAADELWRTLQPGGRLVIEEPDVRLFVVKLVAIAERLALMRSRFLSPPRIAGLSPYPNARVRVEIDRHNAWVIVENEPGG